MQTFYLVLKTLHIYAFIAAIGVTLASLLAYRKFWHVYDKDRTQGLSAFLRGDYRNWQMSQLLTRQNQFTPHFMCKQTNF